MSGNHRYDVNRLLAALPGEFEISEVAGDIPVSAWENIVDNDEAFFRDGDRVVRREALFTGRSFLVTPEAWEIEAGILVPGHRFVPYLDPEVFPSEVVLRRSRRAAAKVEKKFKLSQVLGCFQLLGTEQMLDVLAAESPANGFLRSGIQGDAEVELTVFDLADFYREYEFEAGDAIKCEVSDYAAGVVKYTYLSGAKRSAAKKKAFITALEDACAAALRRCEELPVPEVLAWSFFLGGETLAQPEASLDEFVVESLRIVLSPGAGEGRELRIAADEGDDDAPAPEVPEGFGISSGETGSFPSMLKAVGSSLTSEEIDGFILDCCATRELDFSHFYSRAFGHAAPVFADEAQEAVFTNALEERFEELTTHYDRVDDEIKAPLRSSLMEMVEDRLEFLSELAARSDGEPAADAAKLRRLALVSGKANELIKLLNREEFMPDTAEAERLEAQVENLLDEQDAAFEELRREC